MAKFEGTIKEYHEIIGPRIRNKINNLTRGLRKDRNGICEHCGENKELQSAHVHGRERRVIIEEVLEPYKVNSSDFLKVADLMQVENQILKNHLPVNKNFLFLCQQCHSKYDYPSENFVKNPANRMNNDFDGSRSNNLFLKIDRIQLWAKKPYQTNNKIISAFLYLQKMGPVYKSDLEKLCSEKDSKFFVNRFSTNYASMKTDKGNSHGKVFYDDGVYIHIYEKVFDEIKKFFLV